MTKRDLLATFWRSVDTAVQRATDAWLAFEGGDVRARIDVKRDLHTIKGEAQLLGAPECARLAAIGESLVHVTEVGESTPEVGDAIIGALEGLGFMATTWDTSPFDVEPLFAELEVVLANHSRENATPGASERAPSIPSPAPEPSEKTAAGPQQVLSAEEVQPLIHELHRLGNEQALMVSRLREVQRMVRALMSEIDPRLGPEVIFERLVKTLGYGAEVERRVSALRHEWSANGFAQSRALEELDRQMHSALATTLEALKTRAVVVGRRTASVLEKSVTVETSGDARIEPEIERALTVAVLHLIRNAVDHGIETPEVRRRAGKPERGTIRLLIEGLESSVRVVVEDDGGGIPIESLRSRLGLPAEMDRQDVLQCVFRHGVSTRNEASDISGRGVGLDVVAAEASAIGGSVHVESIDGQGTRFVLLLPTVQRADVVVPVESGRGKYAFPSRSVITVLRAESLVATSDGPCLRLGRSEPGEDRLIRVFSLARVLHGENSDIAGAPLVVLRGREGLFGVSVKGYDSPSMMPIHRVEGLVLRSPTVTGIAPTPDGGVRMLLDPDAIFRVAIGQAPAASDERGAERTAPRALVVEDAPVARELLCGVLRSFGLQVSEAVDGRQGLAAAKESRPDLILTDIEMPFMDGLEMLEELRKAEAFADVPVVILTTRSDEEARSRARALHVRGFLSKEKFVESELRKLVEEAIGRT